MIKPLVITLCGAALATWAWSRRRRRGPNSPITHHRSINPAVPAEDMHLEQVEEVTVPIVQENIPQQGNLVDLPSGSKNPSEPAPAEVHEAASDSGGHTTEQPADTNPIIPIAEPEKLTAPSVGQTEQPAASPGNALLSPNVATAPASTELQETGVESGKHAAEGRTEITPAISTPEQQTPDTLRVGEIEHANSEPGIVLPKTEGHETTPAHDRIKRIVKPERARRILPEHRGGGQMQADEDRQQPEQTEPSRFGPQLQLVCFKGTDRVWRLAVELPENASDGNDVEVRQNDQPLGPVSLSANRWPLLRASGIVEAVERRQDGRRWLLELGSDQYFVFKLLEESETEEGRLVSAPSRGDYLIVAPSEWLTPQSTGIHLSKERNVAITGYLAYRFSVNGDIRPRLEFRPPGGQRVSVPFRTASFVLAGECTATAFGEYQSPVFLRTPPSVRAADTEAWAQVQTVVLGLAGKGRNKWKKATSPNPENNEIQLAEHLNGRKGGWYYLRLYDSNEMLIDSLYFVFATSLSGVAVSGAPLLPPVGGHKDARLEIEHEAGVTVEIVGEQRVEKLLFAGGTAFTVPARWEEVHWQVSWPDDLLITFTTPIGRLWWTMCSEGKVPSPDDWKDKPLVGERAHFLAASEKAVLVRLPRLHSVDSFLVGFTYDDARNYAASVRQRDILILLRDFAASEEVQKVGDSALRIWLKLNGQEAATEILRLKIAYECHFCSKRFRTDVEALAHAVEHEPDFVQKVSYDDLRRQGDDFRVVYWRGGWHRVYGDDDYVDIGDLVKCPSGVWAEVILHSLFIGERVREINNSPWFSHLARPVRFATKQTEQHQRSVARCTKCPQEFDNVAAGEIGKHIFRKHKTDLFKLV